MTRERVEELLAEMTPAEKVGQMTQVEKGSITPGEVADHAIGSVLSGGGGNPEPNDPASWADMVGGFVAAARGSRLGIPLVYGADAVHGHNNVRGAVIFPHNIGLGAAADADLVARAAAVTADELRATGVRWDFAPMVAVATDIRWGRTAEAYADRPDLVAALGAAYVRGLQGDGDRIDVLACPKHYVGDGGTSPDTAGRYGWADWWDGWPDNWHMDQGDTALDEATLRRVHLPPYPAAIAAGARTVMASYSSWNGEKLHGHRRLLTDVLKGELGFDGFVVSDWMGVDQVDPDYGVAVRTAINAGMDMVMVPIDYRRFIDTALDLVARGEIATSRIDDAVRRILAVKDALGLFDAGEGDRSGLPQVGSAAHRAVAREAAGRSAVLLKNEGALLPIVRPPGRVLVAGAGAADLGLQCGGWTIEWLGGRGDLTPGTTLVDALRGARPATEWRYDPAADLAAEPKAELGIVVVAEEPYAEGFGDRHDLGIDPAGAQVVARMRERCDRLVLVVYSGRPMVMTAEIEAADAVVAAWLPGTEGAGVADVLVGDRPFTGRLPRPWPRSMDGVDDPASHPPLFPFGHGLTTVARAL
jgi:beta-glucosidase